MLVMHSRGLYSSQRKGRRGLARQDFTLVKLFRRLLPGQDEFLLPIEGTNEIMLRNQMTFVPRAPRFIEGVIELRGAILSPQSIAAR